MTDNDYFHNNKGYMQGLRNFTQLQRISNTKNWYNFFCNILEIFKVHNFSYKNSILYNLIYQGSTMTLI